MTKTTTPADSFVTVTEVPGNMASRGQLEMAVSRYQIAADLCRGKDALEVACGSGMGLGYIARTAKKVVGLDYDPKLVAIAREHYGDRVQVECGDAQNLPFDDESFDAVVMLEAIYYIPDARKFILEARRVLRPGGALFICSVNREWSEFNPSPFSTRYWSLAELGELLTDVGFKPELLMGFPMDRRGLKGKLFSVAKRLATRFHLIPDTMAGKEKLKRLVFGELSPLPGELTPETALAQPPLTAPTVYPIRDYKVLYAVGRLIK